MEDIFDKHIKGNRDLFDDLNPPGDMWEKISADLQPSKKSKIFKIAFRSTGVAAIIVVALLTYNFFKPNKNSFESNLFSEIRETEVYYNNLVSNKKQVVFELTVNQPEIKEEIDNELALLDSAMSEIKEDLKEDISNQDVVEAMIQNYRMKLNILENILKYIQPKDIGLDDEVKTNEI